MAETYLGKIVAEQIAQVKASEEKEVSYKMFVEKLLDYQRESRAAGLAEGRAEGRANLAAAMQAIKAALIKQYRHDEVMDLIDISNDEEKLRRLADELGVTIPQ